MIITPREAESFIATACKWFLLFILAYVFAVITVGISLCNSFYLVDQSFDQAMTKIVSSCTDHTQPTPPTSEQVRGRAPGLSGEALYTRQTEARAQRTLDPPRIQKPPGWGVGKDLLPAPLPTGEVGW